jgi:hypothetical protein
MVLIIRIRKHILLWLFLLFLFAYSF